MLKSLLSRTRVTTWSAKLERSTSATPLKLPKVGSMRGFIEHASAEREAGIISMSNGTARFSQVVKFVSLAL